MSHLRKQIRDRIITNVTNLTSTGSRVFQTRLYPIASVSLPTLLVYTVSETSEPETMSRPRKIIRRVDFALEGMVNGTSGLDDSLDAIAKDVEEAILTDPTCNALAKDTVLTGTEIDYNASGEQPVHLNQKQCHDQERSFAGLILLSKAWLTEQAD